MIRSILNDPNDDLTKLNEEIDFDLELDKQIRAKQLKNKNLLELEEADLKILKSSLLFNNWADNTFKYFIDDDRVLFKKFKYKDVIAKELECKNNIFVLKSGELMCYTKITRSQIKNHQKVLENCATNPYFLDSNSKYQGFIVIDNKNIILIYRILHLYFC